MIFPQKEDSRSKAQNGLWALNKFETFFHWEKISSFRKTQFHGKKLKKITYKEEKSEAKKENS